MATSPQSPPKRPRLSLQIKAISQGPTGRTSRSVAALVDPKDHANFNALSNAYSSAIDRSAPSAVEPVTAIKTLGQPLLRLQTGDFSQKKYAVTPFTATLPETPLTAQPMSPAVAMEIQFPSTMTATPPLSAGPIDSAVSGAFAFSPRDIASARALNSWPVGQIASPRTPARRVVAPHHSFAAKALPYSHQRGIHSILRNSPLPPRTATTPISPRRQSARLAEKAARRVAYNNPLTQTITTNRYTRSHIDLLCEEASPYSANPSEEPEMVLDLTMAYSGDETRDGGQTPGPFEEMRRRMAGLATSTPTSAGGLSAGGIRKRKKKEKKRRWVWTIGKEEEEGDEGELGGAMAAIKAAEAKGAIVAAVTGASSPPVPTLAIPMAPRPIAKPALPPQLKVSITVPPANLVAPPEIITPSIESDSMSEHMMMDVEMSDSCSVVSTTDDEQGYYSSSYENEGDITARVGVNHRGMMGRGLTPGDMDVDMVTPTVPRKSPQSKRLGSVRLMSEGVESRPGGTRDDTPIPADLLGA